MKARKEWYSSPLMKTLNEVFSAPTMRRRYEVWFLRVSLSDGSGAWWFRYLLMNPGRGGCAADVQGQPVQVWATWFPKEGKPETWIQGFSNVNHRLALSARRKSPFSLEIGENFIRENECRGTIEVRGQRISWSVQYRSNFQVEMGNKGWIGFSRTPHSDAVFSGEISRNGDVCRGEVLGYGMQGHNCGYRHRNFWTWMHAHFPATDGEQASTFEALAYEMPFGLVARKAVLWHQGEQHVFRGFAEPERDARKLEWKLEGSNRHGMRVEVSGTGRERFLHRLHYFKTDCSGRFEVANDSLAAARIVLRGPGGQISELETMNGAVLEMVG